MLREARLRSNAGEVAVRSETGPFDMDTLVMGLAGGLLAYYGLTRFTLGGLLAAGVGGGLICRGVHGDWRIFQTLGIATAGEEPDTRPAPSQARHRTSAREARRTSARRSRSAAGHRS